MSPNNQDKQNKQNYEFPFHANLLILEKVNCRLTSYGDSIEKEQNESGNGEAKNPRKSVADFHLFDSYHNKLSCCSRNFFTNAIRDGSATLEEGQRVLVGTSYPSWKDNANTRPLLDFQPVILAKNDKIKSGDEKNRSTVDDLFPQFQLDATSLKTPFLFMMGVSKDFLRETYNESNPASERANWIEQEEYWKETDDDIQVILTTIKDAIQNVKVDKNENSKIARWNWNTSEEPMFDVFRSTSQYEYCVVLRTCSLGLGIDLWKYVLRQDKMKKKYLWLAQTTIGFPFLPFEKLGKNEDEFFGKDGVLYSILKACAKDHKNPVTTEVNLKIHIEHNGSDVVDTVAELEQLNFSQINRKFNMFGADDFSILLSLEEYVLLYPAISYYKFADRPFESDKVESDKVEKLSPVSIVARLRELNSNDEHFEEVFKQYLSSYKRQNTHKTTDRSVCQHSATGASPKGLKTVVETIYSLLTKRRISITSEGFVFPAANDRKKLSESPDCNSEKYVLKTRQFTYRLSRVVHNKISDLAGKQFKFQTLRSQDIYRNLIRQIGEICKNYSDSSYGFYSHYNGLEFFVRVFLCLRFIEKTILDRLDCSTKEQCSNDINDNTKQDASDSTQYVIGVISRLVGYLTDFNKFVTAATVHSFQAPSLNLLFRGRIERFIISYEEYLYNLSVEKSKSSLKNNGSDSEATQKSFLPLFAVNDRNSRCSRMELSCVKKESEEKNQRREYDYIEFYDIPSARFMVSIETALPMLIHEISHGWRMYGRSKRNDLLFRYVIVMLSERFADRLLHYSLPRFQGSFYSCDSAWSKAFDIVQETFYKFFAPACEDVYKVLFLSKNICSELRLKDFTKLLSRQLLDQFFRSSEIDPSTRMELDEPQVSLIEKFISNLGEWLDSLYNLAQESIFDSLNDGIKPNNERKEVLEWFSSLRCDEKYSWTSWIKQDNTTYNKDETAVRERLLRLFSRVKSYEELEKREEELERMRNENDMFFRDYRRCYFLCSFLMELSVIKTVNDVLVNKEVSDNFKISVLKTVNDVLVNEKVSSDLLPSVLKTVKNFLASNGNDNKKVSGNFILSVSATVNGFLAPKRKVNQEVWDYLKSFVGSLNNVHKEPRKAYAVLKFIEKELIFIQKQENEKELNCIQKQENEKELNCIQKQEKWATQLLDDVQYFLKRYETFMKPLLIDNNSVRYQEKISKNRNNSKLKRSFLEKLWQNFQNVRIDESFRISESFRNVVRLFALNSASQNALPCLNHALNNFKFEEEFKQIIDEYREISSDLWMCGFIGFEPFGYLRFMSRELMGLGSSLGAHRWLKRPSIVAFAVMMNELIKNNKFQTISDKDSLKSDKDSDKDSDTDPIVAKDLCANIQPILATLREILAKAHAFAKITKEKVERSYEKMRKVLYDDENKKFLDDLEKLCEELLGDKDVLYGDVEKREGFKSSDIHASNDSLLAIVYKELLKVQDNMESDAYEEDVSVEHEDMAIAIDAKTIKICELFDEMTTAVRKNKDVSDSIKENLIKNLDFAYERIQRICMLFLLIGGLVLECREYVSDKKVVLHQTDRLHRTDSAGFCARQRCWSREHFVVLYKMVLEQVRNQNPERDGKSFSEFYWKDPSAIGKYYNSAKTTKNWRDEVRFSYFTEMAFKFVFYGSYTHKRRFLRYMGRLFSDAYKEGENKKPEEVEKMIEDELLKINGFLEDKGVVFPTKVDDKSTTRSS